MKITFGSYSRCIKNFTPMKIIPKYKDKATCTDFVIFDKINNPVGQFSMNDGYVYNFSLIQSIRRKKTAADAILSVKNFIIQKLGGKNTPFIYFCSDKRLSLLKKLYSNLGASYIGEHNNKYYYIVPHTSNTESHQYIQNLELQIQNLLKESKIALLKKEIIEFHCDTINKILPFRN